MNKEQFARSVFDSINSDRDGFKNLFENWFEQNPIKPTVVGLTDEQVEGFMSFWSDSPSSDYIGLYKEWAKTQTFAQSRVFTDSEIQQKYMELYDDYQSLLLDKTEIEKKLEVAGDNASVPESVYMTLWNEKYEIEDELEQLKLQQFQPNWDDVPENANFITVDNDGMTAWHELEPYIEEAMDAWGSDGENGIIFNTKRQVFKRPKPPATTVEVGQVWMHNSKTGCDYFVTTIGKFKDSHDECVDSVTYHSKVSDRYYTRTRDDFLAKFQRVGGE
jgi:hypothetical protein